MYLSRLRLNLRSREVRRDLGDLQAIHRTIMSGFPPEGRTEPTAHRVLWRLESEPHEGSAALLVQSVKRPDWSPLKAGYLAEANPDVKCIDAALAALSAGMRLRFRLVANPTKKELGPPGLGGTHAPGKRVPLRGDDEILNWLIRKGAAAGFSVGVDAAASARTVVLRPLGDLVGWRSGVEDADARRLTLRGVAFDGVLALTDADLFRESLAGGIGSGKAYGFGLLSVAPANRTP